MTARKACLTGTLMAVVPLWLACYRFGEAFPQADKGTWPFLLGAGYGLCVMCCGGLWAYLVRLQEMRDEMAATEVPSRQ